MRLMIFDDEKAAIRVLLLEPGVDFLDDVADFRHNGAQKFQVPLLERFAHDSVVRVGKHARGDLERGLEVHALALQKPDELGNRHRRMRVVELHRVKLREPIIVAAVVLAEAS